MTGCIRLTQLFLWPQTCPRPRKIVLGLIRPRRFVLVLVLVLKDLSSASSLVSRICLRSTSLPQGDWRLRNVEPADQADRQHGRTVLASYCIRQARARSFCDCRSVSAVYKCYFYHRCINVFTFFILVTFLRFNVFFDVFYLSKTLTKQYANDKKHL